MILPLRIQCNYSSGRWLIYDAGNRKVCELDNIQVKFASALVKKFNRSWRWRLLGQQPYEYTREDWLWGRDDRGLMGL